MVHLNFRAVPLPFLVVLRWDLQVDVAEEPPIAETLGKVDPTEPATVGGRTRNAQVRGIPINGLKGLADFQCVPLDCERTLAREKIPVASRVLVFHPMTVDALVFERMALNTSVPFQVDRRLVVATTPIRTGRTPPARVGEELPVLTEQPIIWPSQLHPSFPIPFPSSR